MLRDPVLLIVGISTVVGGWLKTVGVKLFSGIVGGGVIPIGDTVMSGITILMIVPGVVEGIVALFAGMKIIGIVKSDGSKDKSIIVPIPLVALVIFKFELSVRLSPVPMILAGPKHILPVS